MTEPWWLWQKVLPDGRWLTLNEMTFGKVRLCVSTHEGSYFYEDGY